MSAHKKELTLITVISELKSVAIAFSGGVDSTYLAAIANKVLGNKALAITIKSEFMTDEEFKNILKIAETLEINHKVIYVNLLKDEIITNNSEQRCFFCKKEMFIHLISEANRNNITNILDGSNIDDLKEFRPGLRALNDLGVKSPLIEAKLSKDEIRLLSKELGLPTWDKLSSPCLATRIPYNNEITLEKLNQIEKAEDFIGNLGINYFRVRHHGNIARIEVRTEDLAIILLKHNEIVSFFKELGFIYITLDLEGYRTGSLNEVLKRMD